MRFKEAVKDTNKKFKHVAECIPSVYIEFILTTLFIVFIPIAYPVAVSIRLIKK